MKCLKHSCMLGLCVLLTFVFAITAFAADSTVTYKGRNSGLEFVPGSSYMESDLFDDFKDVMPGDKRDEFVMITNKSKGSDYINVWMGAILHDAGNNPVSPAVLSALEADKRREQMSELEFMRDFLKQLTLTVWKGEKVPENVIYQGSPDSLENGFEDGKVRLGTLKYDESLELNVELTVDINMGNEYADRIGEVDWVFVIEECNNDSDSDDSGSGGTKPGNKPGSQDWPVDVIEPDEPRLDVLGEVEEDGFQLNVLPMTGDMTVIWPYLVVLVLALIGLIVLIKGRRKEEEK